MLKIATSLSQLRFSELMAVYEEGNRLTGQDRYPHLSENERQLRAEQEFYQYLRECFFPTDGAVYAIWEERGRYVSALRLEPYRDGLLLEALETVPLDRGNGYAAVLIRAVQRWLAERGSINVYSHVDKRNTPSLAVHKACGFENVLDYGVCADGSVMRNFVTLLWHN